MPTTQKRSPEHLAGDTEILTFTGLYVTPLDLQVEQIEIRDIAHALSLQCRFSGHVRRFYSVAQHSVLCSDRLRVIGFDVQIQLQGLLHDASEAYLQDMARPLKEDKRFGQAYRGAETRAEKAIAKKFEIEWPWHEAVKKVDLQLLKTERRDLMPPNGRWAILDNIQPVSTRITSWDPPVAEHRFWQRYLRLQYER